MPNKLFIEDKHFNIVLGILKKYLVGQNKDIKVYIFGSRSTGKNIKKGSDLPYKVDVLDLNSASQAFRAAIDNELTEILF
jgi:predicted nucleotidyltransferase